MAKREIERAVQPSLLDRLTDYEPRSAVEERTGYFESVRQFKAGLQRDLEWLLNTRRIADPPPPELEELARSVYTYGLPDLTSVSRDSPEERSRLLRRVEEAIETFEPRLGNVRISFVELQNDQLRRELRFHVEGMLLMDPTPEQVVFDTVLHVASGEYEVSDAASEPGGVHHA